MGSDKEESVRQRALTLLSQGNFQRLSDVRLSGYAQFPPPLKPGPSLHLYHVPAGY